MSRTLSEKLNSIYSSKSLPWLIISIAIIIRIIEYLNNRSLFGDEAALALPIMNGTFSELLYPLETGQSAPFGFLIIEKLITKLFGANDYTFRLFPFLCGIISPILFYKIATHYIKPKTIPIALGLFAVSDRLIYYSATLKQYSSDVTIALLLYIAAMHVNSKQLTMSRVALFGLLGATAVWFSNPAVFILAGLGLCLALFSFIEKDYTKLSRLAISYTLWAASFTVFFIFYTLYHRGSPSHVFLQNWWAHAFMPFPPSSLSDIKWFIKTFINVGMFSIVGEWWDTLHFMRTNIFSFIIEWGGKLYSFATLTDIIIIKLVISILAMLLLCVGCISMFFEKKRNFFLLITPVIFILAASGLHMFPFADRLLLFLMPGVFLFIAKGFEQISNKSGHNSVIAVIIVLVILFSYPLVSAGYHLTHTRSKHGDIRQVIDYMVTQKFPGDLVYFNGITSSVVCEYYSTVYNLKSTSCSHKSEQSDFISDLSTLKGKGRVWVIIPALPKSTEGIDTLYLDSIGMRIETFKSNQGVSVYLYDFTFN